MAISSKISTPTNPSTQAVPCLPPLGQIPLNPAKVAGCQEKDIVTGDVVRTITGNLTRDIHCNVTTTIGHDESRTVNNNLYNTVNGTTTDQRNGVCLFMFYMPVNRNYKQVLSETHAQPAQIHQPTEILKFAACEVKTGLLSVDLIGLKQKVYGQSAEATGLRIQVWGASGQYGLATVSDGMYKADLKKFLTDIHVLKAEVVPVKTESSIIIPQMIAIITDSGLRIGLDIP